MGALSEGSCVESYSLYECLYPRLNSRIESVIELNLVIDRVIDLDRRFSFFFALLFFAFRGEARRGEARRELTFFHLISSGATTNIQPRG